MTPTEINRTIAEWAGYEFEDDRHRISSDASWNSFAAPDFYHTNAAFDLLDVLVERGYVVDLNCDETGYSIQLWVKEKRGNSWEHFFVEESGKQQSKAAAICEALAILIEKEKN